MSPPSIHPFMAAFYDHLRAYPSGVVPTPAAGAEPSTLPSLQAETAESSQRFFHFDLSL